jgi:hypothetical protein
MTAAGWASNSIPIAFYFPCHMGARNWPVLDWLRLVASWSLIPKAQGVYKSLP